MPRGLCDAIQEAVRLTVLERRSRFSDLAFGQLEQYIEATGYQLAEAMGVSFSRDVAKRLLQMPFRMTGEQGVRSTIAEMIRLRSRDSKEIEKHVGTWASAWLLKASADDKQGQMPPPGANMMEDLQKTLQQTQQAEAKTEADEDDTRKEL